MENNELNINEKVAIKEEKKNEKVLLQGSVEADVKKFVEELRESDVTSTTSFAEALKVLVTTYKEATLANAVGININTEVGAIKGAMESILNNLYNVTAKVETYKGNAIALATKTVQDKVEEIEELKLVQAAELTTLKGRLEVSEEDNARIKIENEKLRLTLKETLESNKDLEKKNSDFVKEVENMKIEKANLNKQLAKALQEVEMLNELKIQVEKMKKELVIAKENKIKMESKIENLMEKAETLVVVEKDNKELNKELTNVKIELATIKEVSKSLNDQIIERDNTIKELKRKSTKTKTNAKAKSENTEKE